MIGRKSMIRRVGGAEGCRKISTLLDRRGTRAVVHLRYRRVECGLYLMCQYCLNDLLLSSVRGDEIEIIDDGDCVRQMSAWMRRKTTIRLPKEKVIQERC